MQDLLDALICCLFDFWSGDREDVQERSRAPPF